MRVDICLDGRSLWWVFLGTGSSFWVSQSEARCILLQGQVAHGGTPSVQPLMSSSPRARRARSLLLCVLSALLARAQKVAVVTSSNCVSVDPSAPHDVGTQFAASLVILMRMKALFPSWTPLVLTNRRDWDKRRGGTSGGLASCDALLTRAQERFRLLHDSELSVLSIDPLTDPLLTRLAHSTGREADHSRGHWPVEAYFPLVAGERLGAMGYSHTVAVDPDAWPLDSRLAAEVGAVRGIACVRAAPAACVGLDPGVHSPESPKAQRALNEEYRLLADPALRARYSGRWARRPRAHRCAARSRPDQLGSRRVQQHAAARAELECMAPRTL